MTIFWAGDEESFALVATAEAKVQELQSRPGMTAGFMQEMLASLPPMWRHVGDTAVIEINGPLVAGDAGYSQIFGVVGYDNIAKAVVDAVNHADTKRMLFHINTPGGDVSGLTEAGDLLTQVSSIKPSAVHSSEMIASAGYWLGTAVKGPLSVGHTALAGSIGVLRVHTERSKMLEDAGIKTTVLRSGAYKAEVNAIEPLTEGAKARAEAQLADVHGMFRAQVGKGRPNLSADDLKDVTEGQTFLGKRAVSAGLADKVGSFDMALKLLDKQKHSRDTPLIPKGKTNMKLTPEQIQAILASGQTLASIGLTEDGTPMTAEELTARDEAVATAEAARIQAEADEAARVKAAAEAADSTTMITTLKAQLETAQAQETLAKADLITANAKVAQFDGLLAIARKATANLSIPLGGSAASVDGMDAAAVVAEHARLTPLFLEKFKVGQQSKGPSATAQAETIDPSFLRRTAALVKSK